MTARVWETIRRRYPGVLICSLLATSAIAGSRQYGVPVMLTALMIGMALHPISKTPQLETGVHTSAKSILKIGVALLGLRIAIGDIADLGWLAPTLVISIVAITIAGGVVLGRLFGMTSSFAFLASGAVAICGVSAAVAINTVLPKRKTSEQELAVVVALVTTLSTIAMILYPIIASKLALSELEAGFFFGGAIHDVAQVVGAGYSVSPKAGDAAIYIKLVRVALLLPVVLIIGFLFQLNTDGARKTSLIPGFLIVFILLAALNSFQLIPRPICDAGDEASRFCIIVSLVAVGMRTDLLQLLEAGKVPLMAVSATTISMGALVLSVLYCTNPMP